MQTAAAPAATAAASVAAAVARRFGHDQVIVIKAFLHGLRFRSFRLSLHGLQGGN